MVSFSTDASFLFEDTDMHSHVYEQEVFSCFYRCSQWGMYRKGCGAGNLLSVGQRPSTLTISKAFWSKAFGIATFAEDFSILVS